MLNVVDGHSLIVSLLGASVVFAIIKRKDIIKRIKKDKARHSANEMVDSIMANENISFEEAKDKLFLDEIVKALEIDVFHWEVNRNLKLIKGDRVSFIDSEVGLVQGVFLGIKKPELVGYDDIYVVRDTKKCIIRQASISYVKEETINAYK